MEHPLIKVSIIFYVIIILTGGLISYWVFRRDRKLDAGKTYRLDALRLIASLSDAVNFLMMGIAALLLSVVLITSSHPSAYYANIILGIFIILCMSPFVYYAIIGIRLFRQYYRLEKNRVICFYNDTIRISDARNGSTTAISGDDIKQMVIYYYSGTPKIPLSSFEFVRIITQDNREFIITSLQMEIGNLAGFLKTKHKSQKYQKINWIR